MENNYNMGKREAIPSLLAANTNFLKREKTPLKRRINIIECYLLLYAMLVD